MNIDSKAARRRPYFNYFVGPACKNYTQSAMFETLAHAEFQNKRLAFYVGDTMWLVGFSLPGLGSNMPSEREKYAISSTGFYDFLLLDFLE